MTPWSTTRRAARRTFDRAPLPSVRARRAVFQAINTADAAIAHEEGPGPRRAALHEARELLARAYSIITDATT